ncbi:caspase family protein [Streptomyces olivaceus]|uniref:wHTH domain-containing protein n=1 Tax=Streptomyces olivaceus TaxID=47716 RepID=UPI003807AF62
MHKALLLFVNQYESTDWPDLLFLSKEYEGVRDSLSAHGYDIDQRSACGDLDASTLNERIESFIQSGHRRDHLIVYLSGHGYHFDRTHWFAAHDSKLTGQQTMNVTNVKLDGGWADLVEASKVEQVLFVVDACRDRLVDSGHPSHLPAVSPPEGSERLTYLMACAPEQAAVFVSPDSTADGTFSLFTQAFREVLSDVSGNLPVDSLRRVMEEVMDDLHSHHCSSTPAQVPRLGGEEGASRFPVLPSQCPISAKKLASENAVWEMTSSGHQKSRAQYEVGLVCSHLDENLRKEQQLLSSDPWIDWHAHVRASQNLEKVIGYLPTGFQFATAEVALLVLLPHLYHGFRIRLARQVDQILNRSFEALSGSHEAWSPYSRLQRQTESRLGTTRGRRDRKMADAWVLHQYLARPGDAHKHEDELLRYLDIALAGTDELTEILTIDTVSWLFRAMLYGGSTLAEEPDFYPERREIRYQLIGYVLAAAQAMALDIAELPPVLVEHSGGKDCITFLQIRETVKNARWQAAGRTLRLEARCPHQAVMVALQERAEFLDGLLYTATDVRGLERLPNRASGDAVSPEEDIQTGRLKFLPVATRFGLDGTRVRDLLAGEQLYSDRSLAIRELYQNALDACNVRKAREIFRPGESDTTWQGQIEIRQGSAGSVQFIECIDNGSGMGRGELLHAFAQGGVRLSHLMEFQEEKLQWRRKGIQFHENSRFGIGVLSYFMLADEIEVVTCKFHRDRARGRVLKVAITGPDNLFHVEESTDDVDFLGEACGTRVRLYLRNDVSDFSCVAALRPVLGVAVYTTSAEFEGERETWEPNTYISRSAAFDQGRIDASGSVVADPGGEVFWCEHGGALLVDGISVEGSWAIPGDQSRMTDRTNVMKIPGAVVNLAGAVIVSEGQRKRVPRLTVDRNQIIDDVSDPVTRKLRAATASLLSADFFTSFWLEKAVSVEPRLADVIVEGLVDLDARLAFSDGFAQMGRTGYFPGDEIFRTDWQSANFVERDPNSLNSLPDQPSTPYLPPHLSLWRYAAHFPDDVKKCLGDLCPSDWADAVMRPAMPSDAVLLGGSLSTLAAQEWDAHSSLARALHSSLKLQRDLASVMEQLEALGQSVPFATKALSMPRQALHSLLGAQTEKRGFRPFVQGLPISPVSLLRACHSAKLRVPEAIGILTNLGYDVSRCIPLEEEGSAKSKLAIDLLSDRFDGRSPWFTGTFDTRRILAASEKLRLHIEQAAAAYEELGFKPTRDTYIGSDYKLQRTLSRSCVRSGRASVADVIRGAHATGESTLTIAKRIRAFGLAVEGEVPHVLPEGADLLSLSGGIYQNVDPSHPVSLPELNFLASRKGVTLEMAARQLREMGLKVPFNEYPESLSDQDISLLAKGLETSEYRSTIWLNPTEEVPLAHVLLAADSFGMHPHAVRDRLATLGMKVPDILNDLPHQRGIFREYRVLREWIPYGGRQTIPLCVIMWCSIRRGGSIPAAVQFLKQRGYTVPDVPEDLEQVHDLDVALLEKSHVLSFRDHISTEAVVGAAQAAGVSVIAARQRLVELGARISVPGSVRSHHHADSELFKQVKWSLEFVPAALVMVVSDHCACSPLEVSLRLQAAGFTVQDFEYPSDRPNHTDLIMLRVKASAGGNYVPVSKPVELEQLLLAAHRLGWSVRDVAQRLSVLGMAVPDVEDAVRRAWSGVPKVYV